MQTQTFTVVCRCVNVFVVCMCLCVCANDCLSLCYAFGCGISQLAQHLQKGVKNEWVRESSHVVCDGSQGVKKSCL